MGIRPENSEGFSGISPYKKGGGLPGGGLASTRSHMSSFSNSGGLFNSHVPGRTDKLNTDVPAGAYVLPADVVSGLGQGNTMAGSKILDKMFSTGPYGIGIPSGHRGVGIPEGHAAGGKTKNIPIIAAGGEYLVSPEVVSKIGGGDMDKGHKILDKFVLHVRKSTTDEMKKLPGPKK